MSATLPDLRERLAERAAVTPTEVVAARARLEGRLVRADRPARHGRRVLVTAVVALVVGVLGVPVVAVLHERPTSGPAAATAGPLPLTDWLFTVRPDALPSDLDVVEYVRATPDVQIAAVLRPGDASTSNAFSAVVEVASDAATIGVGARPRGAVSLDGDAWTAPQTDDEYGVSGVQVVWTDSAGRTVRVVAPDDGTASVVRAAVDLEQPHPVRFPVEVPEDWLPAGSTVASVDFTGTQGVEAAVDVPGSPTVRLAVAAPGVFIDDGNGGQVPTAPFAAGFRITTSSSSQILHSPSYDLRVVLTRAGVAEWSTFPVDRLRTLAEGIRGVPMALFPDQSTWFPLVDALPTT